MNRLQTLRRPLACLALPLVLAFSAPQADAQRLAIGFGTHGHHGSINLSAGFAFGAPFCDQPVYRPPQPVWIPGHYQLVDRRVFVAGCVHQEYVPPVFEERLWRDACGRVHVERIQTCPATWRTVQGPGKWECITERIWIEGGWSKVAY